jgi:opacity protein-like surface antigen
MNRGLVAATLLALGAAAGSAHADENPSGFYIGGGVGQFNVKIDDIDDTDNAIQKLDDDDTAWKAFIGWRFNPYISIEAAYIDFGNPNGRATTAGSSGNYSADLSGFAPYVIGTLPLGPVELFAKAGYYYYDVKLSANIDRPLNPSFRSKKSDEDFLYGFGVGMTFFDHLNARLEYERIDSDLIDDADALWFSGAWRF